MKTLDPEQRNIDLIYRLKGLRMTGCILHVGAHPDDEDIGLISYMAHKFGVRAVYWSATRGEGGQNRIGLYKQEALGVYRTWEALSARQIDGGESLYGPFFDFGYSKNAEETLNKWVYTEIVRQIVRAIRMVQPQIIVSRWMGVPEDFHGHHQAVGKAVYEAFDAAANPSRFSRFESEGLMAWQPQKFYHSMTNTGGDLSVGGAVNLFGFRNKEFERDGVLRINTGELDPAAGNTYQEQAWLAYNQNKTQAMGLAPAPGDFYYYYQLHKSLVPTPVREKEMFDGLDPTLTGLADYPGTGSPLLRNELEQVKAGVDEAVSEFRANDPMKAAKPLLESLALLREIQLTLSTFELPVKSQKMMNAYLERKIKDFEEVAALCLGLRLESLIDTARVTPGQKFRLTSRLWNHRNVPLNELDYTIGTPAGWKIESMEEDSAVSTPAELGASHYLTVSERAELSCPYWLKRPRESCCFQWPEGASAGKPFEQSPIYVECNLTIGKHKIRLREFAVLRQSFPGGYRKLPLAVIPPISLHPKEMQEFLSVRSLEQQIELTVAARSNVSSVSVEGRLELEVPAGWKVFPENIDLCLAKFQDISSVRFIVTVPKDAPPGKYFLRYVVEVENHKYDVILNPVRKALPGLPGQPDAGNCILEEFITTPAEVKVHLFNLEFVQNQTYGYVKGADEEILKNLSRYNLDFHLIVDEEMEHIHLDRFDAIVIGPNAYLIRDKLRENAVRFLRYVERGGTLVVQHQGYAYEGKGYAPYPFRYIQPHDRVTDEKAPVTILNPDHAVFNFPNRIGKADFDDWFKDRGLYFFHEWDRRYEPLVECHDFGEEPQKGGFLIAGYGRGTYFYTGYSFFNQLSAGVAGAFRLMANILGLPEARIIERIDFLKKAPLFSRMAHEHLDAAARIMSETWVEHGQYICRQGEEGNEAYIICRGEVEVILESEGHEKIIYLAKRGDCLGEMAIMGSMPRTASLRTRGDVRLLVIKGDRFISLLREDADISIELMKLLANRLNDFLTMEKQ